MNLWLCSYTELTLSTIGISHLTIPVLYFYILFFYSLTKTIEIAPPYSPITHLSPCPPIHFTPQVHCLYSKVRIVTSCRHLLAGFPIFGLWVLCPTDNLPPLSEATQSIQLNLLPFSRHKLYKPNSLLALSCESPLKQVWPWGRHYPP